MPDGGIPPSTARLELNAHVTYAAPPPPFRVPTSPEHLASSSLTLLSCVAFSQFIQNFQNPSRSTCFKPNRSRHKINFSEVIVTILLPRCIMCMGKAEEHPLYPMNDPNPFPGLSDPGIWHPPPSRWSSCGYSCISAQAITPSAPTRSN